MDLVATLASPETVPPAGDGRRRFTLGPLGVTLADTQSHLYAGAGPLLLVGELFTASGDPVTMLGPGQTNAIVMSQGRWLTANLWGRYLAFWVDPRDNAAWAMRDPSGAVPLYRLTDDGEVTLFSSRLALPDDLRGMLAIDREGLAHRLAYPALPTRATGLAGVAEILPGEAVRVASGGQGGALWSPWTFAGDDDGPGPEAVRQAVDVAVSALSRNAGPLLLELSGGLDSSILAGSLAAAGRTFRGATLVTPGAGGDERRYAQAVADRCRIALAELSLGPDALDFLVVPQAPDVRPSGYAILSAIDQRFRDCAAADGATLVSGTGGDNVFCALRSAAPLLDRLAADGWPAARSTARDLARLTQVSTTQTALAAWRYWRADRARPVRWRQDRTLLAPDVVPPLRPHPWLERPPRSRPGTRAHIVAILRAHAVIATLERARDGRMLFPLVAQPVVEACLRIPSWRWVAGGVDRAIARQAFADRLPELVRARRTKGRLSSLLAPAFDRQRTAIRELLCDGILADLGLIDRDAIAAAAAAPANYDGSTYMRLLELADAELWARGVTQQRRAGPHPGSSDRTRQSS